MSEEQDPDVLTIEMIRKTLQQYQELQSQQMKEQAYRMAKRYIIAYQHDLLTRAMLIRELVAIGFDGLELSELIEENNV